MSGNPVVDAVLLSAKEESILWDVLIGVRQAIGAPDEASAFPSAPSTVRRMLSAGWIELCETDAAYSLVRVIPSVEAKTAVALSESWSIPTGQTHQIVIRTTDVGDSAFASGVPIPDDLT